jgi:hypothetical protein
MKQVTKPSDVPNGAHYAVLVYETRTVHIPGDERSRTNPGHGYPAHDETFRTTEHCVTTDRADWLAFITKCANSDSHGPVEFSAFEVAKVARVTKEVKVKVGVGAFNPRGLKTD